MFGGHSANKWLKDKTKKVSFTVNLPQEIDARGVVNTEIIAEEIPDDVGMVKAAISVSSNLYLRVLFEGLYADSKLFIEDEENGVYFEMPILNYGEEDINIRSTGSS